MMLMVGSKIFVFSVRALNLLSRAKKVHIGDGVAPD